MFKVDQSLEKKRSIKSTKEKKNRNLVEYNLRQNIKFQTQQEIKSNMSHHTTFRTQLTYDGRQTSQKF